jgi:hypothetical protein
MYSFSISWYVTWYWSQFDPVFSALLFWPPSWLSVGRRRASPWAGSPLHSAAVAASPSGAVVVLHRRADPLRPVAPPLLLARPPVDRLWQTISARIPPRLSPLTGIFCSRWFLASSRRPIWSPSRPCPRWFLALARRPRPTRRLCSALDLGDSQCRHVVKSKPSSPVDGSCLHPVYSRRFGYSAPPVGLNIVGIPSSVLVYHITTYCNSYQHHFGWSKLS